MKKIEGQTGLDFDFEEDTVEHETTTGDLAEALHVPIVPTAPMVKTSKKCKNLQALGLSATPSVTLHKGGGKIVITPDDLMASISLIEIRERLARLSDPIMDVTKTKLVSQLLPDVTPEDFSRATRAWSLVGKKVEEHPMGRLLQRYGLQVHLSPSLGNWLKKEERRLVRELTPFLLPDYKDDRALFEKVEAGMVLNCIKDYKVEEAIVFQKGERYQVVDTSRGGSGGDAQENHEHQDGVVKISKLAISPGVKILMADETVYQWTVFNGDMEPFFHFEEQIIYDPEKCMPAKYPELIKMYEKKLDKMNLELYDHVRVDVVQEAIKRATLNGKLMRMGKAVSLDTYLISPTGLIQMRDIKIGDQLFGADGFPVEVEAIYPQNPLQLYNVEFSDGVSIETCGQHLWEVYTAEDKYNNRPIKIISTQEIRNNLKYTNGNTKYYIPMVEPLRFPEREFSLDPYVLGVLLGDGCLGGDKSTPSFASIDPEIVKSLRRLLPSNLRINKITNTCSYNIAKKEKSLNKNPLQEILENLGVNKGAADKFIPNIYKFSSIEQRKDILQGLLDTDGCSDLTNGLNVASTVEFTSISKTLRDDVQFIVESLGGVGYVSDRIPTYTYKGEKKKGQRAYRLRISLPGDWIPFRLKRKRESYKAHSKFPPTRGIVAIEPTRIAEAQCITVSRKRGLFTADHCILTHNTSESIVCALLWTSSRVAIVAPRNARIFTVKEFERLGLKDYVVVDSMSDFAKPAKFYLLTYSWLKKTIDPHRISRRKGQGYLHRSYTENKKEVLVLHKCPFCKRSLERLDIKINKSVDTGFVLEKTVQWTKDKGYICLNPNCEAKLDFTANDGAPVKAAWGWTIDPETGKRKRAKPIKIGTPLPDNLVFEQAEDKLSGADIIGASSPAPLLAKMKPRLGYIDWGLRFHQHCKDKDIKGRYCHSCHTADATWTPAPYRQKVFKPSGKKISLKDFFTGAIIDEIHTIKSLDSDTGKAVRALRSRRRMGLTGTLMPNTPADSFWPLHWTFKGGSAEFPFHQKDGALEFYDSFCEYINIKRSHGLKDSRKMLPYLKNPIKFWELMSSKMVRRNYEDPLVQTSLAKANRFYPDIQFHRVESVMDPKQAQLMLAAINHFEQNFNEYSTQVQNAGHLLNQAMVVSQMIYLRIGATCPEYFNAKLDRKIASIQDAIKKANKEKINTNSLQKELDHFVDARANGYSGPNGGGKMSDIQNIVATKTANNEKVVILSDFVEMRKSLAKALIEHNPIVFDGSWTDEERNENFEAFLNDFTRKVFIAGTRQVREGTNLSSADTVICCDLLWEPGLQQQAWSRAFTPTANKRTCNVYVLMAKGSIDEHVYNTFYAKVAAAEQALDRKVINRRANQVDLRWFVERVLSDRDGLIAYLKEEGEKGVMISEKTFQAFEDREI